MRCVLQTISIPLAKVALLLTQILPYLDAQYPSPMAIDKRVDRKTVDLRELLVEFLLV